MMWGLLQLFEQNTLMFQLLRTKLEALRQKHRALLAAGNGDGDEKRRLVTSRHQAVRSQAGLRIRIQSGQWIRIRNPDPDPAF